MKKHLVQKLPPGSQRVSISRPAPQEETIPPLDMPGPRGPKFFFVVARNFRILHPIIKDAGPRGPKFFPRAHVHTT
jgi:hypothetical protein